MRSKDELDITTNRRVYKRRYKEYIAHKVGLCTYCKWHQRENASRKPRHGHRKMNKVWRKS